MIISTNTNWSGIVNLSENVEVAPGVSLNVSPGTKITGGKIIVYGSLIANGTPSNKIEITDSVIAFSDNYGTAGYIGIDHARIVRSNVMADAGSGSGSYGSFALKNSTITDSPHLYVWYPTGDCEISGNLFLRSGGISAGLSGNKTLLVANNTFVAQTTPYAVENWALYSPSKLIVEGNSFLSTDRVALSVPSGYSSSAMDARANYFGTTDSAVIASMVLDRTDSLSRASVINTAGFLSSPSTLAPVYINTTGTAGSDSLVGSAEDELLDGLAGNDTLRGGGGGDTLAGGDGNDLLIAGGTKSTYEIIDGYFSWDQAVADAKNRGGQLATIGTSEEWDEVVALLPDKHLWLGGTQIQPDGSRGSWRWIDGTPWTFENWGAGQPDNSDGLEWSLMVFSAAANVDRKWNDERVYGTDGYVAEFDDFPFSGDVSLSGGAGVDTLRGSLGNDTLDGGAAADSMVGGAGNDLYFVESVLDSVSESDGAGTDSVRSSVTFALSANIESLELTGSSAINGTGNELSNSITGNGGANFLSAGDGRDTVRGGAGNDTLIGYWGNDVLDGGEGNDSLEAGSGEDTLTGGAGADTLIGWDEADRMSGGAGNDFYIVENADDVVVENANQGTDTVQSTVSFALGANVENLELVGSSAINAQGNELANRITGNFANNLLEGGEGADTILGGAGNDTVFAYWQADVVDGGEGNDYLTGGTDTDTLSGGAGNDTLWGDEDADRMLGGAGNDLYVADDGADVVAENANEGTDTVRSRVTRTLSANVENLELTGVEEIDGTGNALANVITGNAGRNNVFAGEGNDTVRGGGGGDALYGESGNDAVSGEAGNDQLYGGLDNDLLDGGADNDNLFGEQGADTVVGGAGNDYLDGGLAGDSMSGGAGNDTYFVDNDGDVVVELAGGGFDTVISLVTRTLGAEQENLELTGSAAIKGTGNVLGNRITGNDAANVLDGGAGMDTLSGGNGNDTYVVDNAGDVVVEMTGFGTDSVQSSVTHTLAANVEHLVLTGSAAINGTGNASANNMAGNELANVLAGGEGNDTLSGGEGNDTLSAGRGTDSVVGGAGNDLLVVDWAALPGAVIGHKVDKVGASFKGVITAKNTAGTVLSQVTLDSIESFLLNGKSWSPEPPKPGVSVSRTSAATATTEQGGLIEYSVALQAAPKENVSVDFSSSDATEARVNTPTLTFTPQNWDKPQKLVIQGVDDFLDDKDVAYTIQGKVVTDDLTYNRVTVASINVINLDDTEDKPFYFPGPGEKNDGVDYIQGKNGNDTIYGGQSQDELRGGRGDDELLGEQDNDRLLGELGNDALYGGYGGDMLDGGEGADSLFGEQGRDTLFGGAGNDYLSGGELNDSMSGGAGNDTYLVDSTGDVINDLGAATDVDTVQVIQTISYTLPANVENASISATGNANLTGNTLNNGLTGNDGRNVIDGGSGNDKLDGGGGADSLLGGVGNDIMLGGGGNDTMRGGEGVDLADFAAAGVDLSVDLSMGRITGEGTDLIFDIENILAGDGQDTLLGNAAGNDLDGGAGIDNLNGGAGNDTLAGCFFGANGGRGETDTLTGGAGIDVFQLGWSSGRFYDDGIVSNAGRNDYVLITDFTVGQDRLQLDGAAGNYYLGTSGVLGVAGTGLWAEQGATDELIAIIRSANTTQPTAVNTINTAQFV